MSTLRVAFGRTIREIRQELGLSQEKLAQKVKVSRNFLGSVERGESSLSLEVAERVDHFGPVKPLEGVDFASIIRSSFRMIAVVSAPIRVKRSC